MGVGILQHKGNKLDSSAIGKKPWAYRIGTLSQEKYATWDADTTWDAKVLSNVRKQQLNFFFFFNLMP
jgi:hypothetical protein